MAKCPNCEQELELKTVLLDEETFTMRVTWEGAAIEAKTVGGIIDNTRKLLVSAAKEVGGDYACMMKGIDWGDHEASFHFLLMRKPKGDDRGSG